MTDEILAKTFATVGMVAAGTAAVGIPDNTNSWIALMEKFGVLAFVLMCGIAGIAFIVPRLLDMTQQYFERQDERYDKAQDAFMSHIERQRLTLEKTTEAIDKLADYVKDLKR